MFCIGKFCLFCKTLNFSSNRINYSILDVFQSLKILLQLSRDIKNSRFQNINTYKTFVEFESFQVLTALEKKYHPEHFVCIKCKLPITGSNFQQHEGEPVCEADYAKYFLKKCHGCKLPIRGVSRLLFILFFSLELVRFMYLECHTL